MRPARKPVPLLLNGLVDGSCSTRCSRDRLQPPARSLQPYVHTTGARHAAHARAQDRLRRARYAQHTHVHAHATCARHVCVGAHAYAFAASTGWAQRVSQATPSPSSQRTAGGPRRRTARRTGRFTPARRGHRQRERYLPVRGPPRRLRAARRTAGRHARCQAWRQAWRRTRTMACATACADDWGSSLV